MASGKAQEDTHTQEFTKATKNKQLPEKKPSASPLLPQDAPKVHFKGEPKEEFLAAVRKRAEAYFIAANKPKTANWIVHLKGALFAATLILIYLTLLNGWFPGIPRIAFWLAFGLNQSLIAVNIGHDALHGSYSSSPLVNKILGFLAYDCIGMNSYIWKQTHNREHHTYTNIVGADPDINKPGILRLSPHDPLYKIHKYQHLYIWFLYSLVSMNWILISDFTYMLEKRKEIPKKEFFNFFFFKTISLTLMLFIPLLYFPMPWWQVLLGFAAYHIAGGLAVAIIFQLAHLVENVDFPLPDENGVIANNWGAHEMATTSNFATNSPFVTHAVGGLNFQIEHHLLPKISHCHYLELSKIVKEAAKEYGLPYHELPSMRAAILSHARYIKKLGQNP